ncbi:MAG: hypothetical protein ACRDGQ_04235, partial [Candidatus Limnocylindrales bacterium]
MSLAWLSATVSLARFALRRVRADLPALVLAGLVLTAATSLVASSVQYSDAVAIAGLQRAILDGPPTARGISVETTAQPGQVGAFDGLVAGTLSRALGPDAPVVLAARSASLAPFGLPSDQAALHLTVLGGYPNLDQHARLTSGSWPVAGHSPVQATLSTAAAKALGLAVGDQLGLVDASVPGTSATPLLTVVVTGTWTTNPDDPYWLGDPLDLDGIVDQGSLAYRGPFMVAPSDLLSRGLVAHLDLTWRAGPSGRIVPADLGRLESALPAIAPSLAAGLPPRQPLNVSAGLAPLLAGLSQGLALAQGGVTLLILQFVVLAAFAVILVAALLADRRRREHRMLQARGASSFQVLLIATGEAVLVT